MNVLSLFAGIGDFDLGLESVGFRTVAFCEIEPFPRAVLAARWPGVPIYPDVRTLTAAQLAADGVVRPDLVCGGFPCQDISAAGRGAGIDGVRSGLWREMARIIGEVRPRWVVVENSPALRSRGADRVLADLESLGYAAWPSVVGAVHAGAWHRRQRVWIVAYADCERHEGAEPDRPTPGLRRRSANADGQAIAYTDADRSGQPFERLAQYAGKQGAPWREPDGLDQGGWRDGAQWREDQRDTFATGDGNARSADASGRPAQPGMVRLVYGVSDRLDRSAGLEAAEGFPWFPISQEPDIPRTARGVANRAERIAGLGNAVVPDVVAMIGRAILAVEAQL